MNKWAAFAKSRNLTELFFIGYMEIRHCCGSENSASSF